MNAASSSAGGLGVVGLSTLILLGVAAFLGYAWVANVKPSAPKSPHSSDSEATTKPDAGRSLATRTDQSTCPPSTQENPPETHEFLEEEGEREEKEEEQERRARGKRLLTLGRNYYLNGNTDKARESLEEAKGMTDDPEALEEIDHMISCCRYADEMIVAEGHIIAGNLDAAKRALDRIAGHCPDEEIAEKARDRLRILDR